MTKKNSVSSNPSSVESSARRSAQKSVDRFVVLGRALAQMCRRHAILRAESVVETAQAGEAARERETTLFSL
jgi:hypothetical protein